MKTFNFDKTKILEYGETILDDTEKIFYYKKIINAHKNNIRELDESLYSGYNLEDDLKLEIEQIENGRADLLVIKILAETKTK